MDVKGLFYIISGAQVPFYLLDLSQWFTLDPIPYPESELFQKTIEMEGREIEVCVSKAGNRHEFSGIKLVTPVELKKGEGMAMHRDLHGRYGFWSAKRSAGAPRK
jgi:hypothetical protein